LILLYINALMMNSIAATEAWSAPGQQDLRWIAVLGPRAEGSIE
jgi:hypothetical protein